LTGDHHAPGNYGLLDMAMAIKWVYDNVYAFQVFDAGVKVLFKNVSIFFLCPCKQFLLISFQIQLLEYFPQKQKEKKTKQLWYTDKLVTTQS
jgi:hypothetical protein